MKFSEVAKGIKPYIVPWIAEVSAGVAGSSIGLSAHELSGPYHTGTLNRSQAPWVATDIAAAIAAIDDIYVNESGDTMFGDLRVDAAIGINVAPTDKLEVVASASGATRSSAYFGATFHSSSNTGIQLLSPATGVGLIAFGDPGNPSAGRILYRHTIPDRMDFETAGSLRMIINSTGQVAIAHTAPAHKLDILGTLGVRDAGGLFAEIRGSSTLYNLGIGANALAAITSGGYNLGVGSGALLSNTTGANNFAAGAFALANNIGGANNVALGGFALVANTSGQNNLAIALNAMAGNTTGGNNVAIGVEALYSNVDTGYNVAIGASALRSATANYNVAIGPSAGYSVTTMTQSILIGVNAGYAATGGSYNIAIGGSAGYSITTGYGETMIGYKAGFITTTGPANTFIGYQSGMNNVGGQYNTFIGYSAGQTNAGGHYNTFIGPGSGFSNVSGQQSIYIGLNTGYLSTGNFNTFIGSTAGYNNVGASNVFIGYAAGFNETGSNKLVIANTNTATPLIKGDFAIPGLTITGNTGINTDYTTTAALKVYAAATDDITLFLKQRASQTARILRVEDSAGQELIVLDSQGNLQSGNPGFVSGLTGWQVSHIGNAEFNNAWIRGELHASIFVMDEFHASGGTLYIAPAGKLELDATVYTTTGVSAVLDIRTTSASGSGSQIDIRTTSASGSGTQLTSRWIENYFEITDPPSGHAMILSAGDRIRCKALGLGVGIDLWDVWGVVSAVEDMTDYYRYYYDRKSGGTNGLIIPAGTAIISYGAPGDGRIYLTADQNYAPYMQVFITGEEPWNGQITPTVRIGRLDGVGLPGVSGIEQYGMVTSSDLSDASAPYMVMSNLQQFQYNIDSEWNNGNPTARITSGGSFLLGTDIDNPNSVGLSFDPSSGTLNVGNGSYPGTVTVTGKIIVQAGSSGYVHITDKPTSLGDINAGEGTKLTGIAAGATVGATWGTNLNSIPTRFGDAPSSAGLYLTPTHLGYYNGSAWKAWIASSGEFYFGGNSGAHLEWNGSKLRGIGTDGTTEQWYAQSSDGKLYAGAGSVWIDSTGVNLTSALSFQDSIRVKWFNGANKQFWIGASGTSGTQATLWAENTASDVLMDLIAKTPSTSYSGNIRIQVTQGASSSQWNFIRTVGGTVYADFPGYLNVAGGINPQGDIDMNGYDIIDADNVMGVRSTA